MRFFDLEKHEQTKCKLRINGSSLFQVARTVGVSPAFVTHVSQGRKQSLRIQQGIADALGVEPSSIWPERYEQGEGEMTTTKN
ncbi:helix-turn-helix domain-containing protein [Aliiroseovarius sp.]|uniref:helix-turn-helix domain-containing protein n=1 Tax=Aliiroseovarius sp. TaxID=1872442 RepID=UPI003BACAB2D